MKKLTTKLNFWLATLSVCCLVYACSQEDLENVSSDAVQSTVAGVRVVNGYLEFKDQATLDSLKAQLVDKSREELDAWESQFKGFTSLRSLDEQSVDAQEAWFEELSNMPRANRLQLMQSDEYFFYSDFIKQHKSSFILQDSGVYTLNTTAAGHHMLSLLNENGIIKVNGKIFLHKRNIVKVITDGDDSKLQHLEGVTSSNEKLGIIVLNNLMNKNVPENAFQIGAYGLGSQAIEKCEDRNNNDDRVTADLLVENFFPLDYEWPEQGYTWGGVTVVAENWTKGLFGGWRRKNTSALSVQGSVFILYSFSPISIIIPVNGSVSSQVSRFTVNIWRSDRTYEYEANINNVDLYAQGNLIVYGRGGTKCGDVATVTYHNQPWK